jgi:Phage integrase, N-terminal SAM-like domain
MSLLAPTLQAFFTDRLTGQRQASAHTIAAYRDTIRMLLAFAAEHSGKAPSDLDVDDLQAPLIGAFLDHLEHERGNTIRTRNARLAAIRARFATPPCATPSTPPRSNASWRSRPSATIRRSSRSSPTTSSRRCSMPPTRQPGSAAATTR